MKDELMDELNTLARMLLQDEMLSFGAKQEIEKSHAAITALIDEKVIGPYEGKLNDDGTISLDDVENVGDSFVRNNLRAEQHQTLGGK